MTSRVITGDCREVLATLDAGSVQCVVTSPPYANLRDYGHPDQIGAEATAEEYIVELVNVFRLVRRVLRDDGALWLNLGDGMADKQLRMIPARVALALQADAWVLRSDIIWAKPNPMPESVQGSHFSRHMVTLAEYERLSGLPYSAERAGEDWAGDVPSLCEAEIPGGKAPVSAEREGDGDSPRAGRAAGRAGKASAVRGIGARAEQPGDIRIHSEGQGDQADIEQAISSHRAREAQGGREASGDEGLAASDRPTGTRQCRLREVGQDGGEEAPRLREAEGCDSPRDAVHGRDVAGDGGPAQEPLSLLQATPGADARPHHPGQQGRVARSDEHRSGVPKLQFAEEQPTDPARLVPCPGCEKCAQHHGYTFHLSAGRPTSAHEHVFLLSKRASYFYDADAVREVYSPLSLERSKYQTNAMTGSETVTGERGAKISQGGARADYPINPNGANCRNVWSIATQPYSGAHFATMPPELAERCIKAGTRPGDTVLDPFAGAGTTLLCADRLGRNGVGIELNPAYAVMARNRLTDDCPLFADVAD